MAETITAPAQVNSAIAPTQSSPPQNGRRRVTKVASLSPVISSPAPTPAPEMSKEYLESGYLPEIVEPIELVDEANDQHDQQLSPMYDSQMDTSTNAQFNVFSKPVIKKARGSLK